MTKLTPAQREALTIASEKNYILGEYITVYQSNRTSAHSHWVAASAAKALLKRGLLQQSTYEGQYKITLEGLDALGII